MNVKAGGDLVGSDMVYDVEPKPLDGEIDSVDVPVFFLLGRRLRTSWREWFGIKMPAAGQAFKPTALLPAGAPKLNR